MQIYFAGVCHQDCLCRRRLCEWLKIIKKTHGIPIFIATEWDEKMYNDLRKKRPDFKRLLKQDIEGLEEYVYEELAATLAYEGDIFRGIFPNAKVIWLEEGKYNDPDKFIKERSRQYECAKYFFSTNSIDVSESEALLNHFSRTFWNNEKENYLDGKRDDKWANKLLPVVNSSREGYSIVIVGAKHLDDNDKTIYGKMKKANVAVKKKIFQSNLNKP